MPFKRFDHYKQSEDSKQAAAVLDAGIALYQRLIAQGSDLKKIAYIRRLQYLAFARKGDWQKIVESLDENMSHDESSEGKGRWLLLKALVTEKRLQDRKQALQLYQSFLAQYPEHSLTKLAKHRQELLLQTA